MSSYMLFVPDEKNGQGLTERLGIGEIESAGEPTILWNEVPRGPAGEAPGMLGFWLDPNVAVVGAFQPLTQRWILAPGKKFWIGLDTIRPLVPEDLERRGRPPMTAPVLLADGNTWQIPVAHYMPAIWGTDDEGKFTRTPETRFREFCRQAEAIDAQFQNRKAGQPLHLDCQWEYLCTALSLCYRLAPPIISALELIDDRSGPDLIAATVEQQFIREVEAQKKTTG